MAEQNRNKDSAYAQLTGFRRAVPIILVALAVFTGLCFIMQNTGTLGQAISRLLLGLFSIGGYFIPFFLAIHAIFYASDVQKKRLVGRIIFTVLTVFTISALTHTIAFYSDAEKVFSPSQFYSDGTSLRGGGFVGGILSYAITYLFGNIGLIIIAFVMFALYVTYFLSSGKSSFPAFFAKIRNAFSSLSDSSKTKKEKKRIKKAERVEERKRDGLRLDQDELSDDEFFGVENGMKEISIPALDIRQVRSDADLESDPHLQEKVFPRAEVKRGGQTSRFDYGDSYAAAADTREKQRPVNMEYSTTDSKHGLSVSVDDSVFKERDDDIVIEPAAKDSGEVSGESARAQKEASADELFASGSFEPYDFKISEEISNRPSSKAAKADAEPVGIKLYEKSISDVTPEDVEKARQRADFEMRKRADIEARKKYAEEQAAIAREKAREANEAERLRLARESAIEFTYGTPDPEANAFVDTRAEAASPAESAVTREAYIPDYMKESEEPVKAPEAEAEKPAREEAAAAEDKTASTESQREQYRRAALFASAISDYEMEKKSAEFKPYATPTVAEETREEEKTILVERSMLEPTVTPVAIETEKESADDAEITREPAAAPVYTPTFTTTATETAHAQAVYTPTFKDSATDSAVRDETEDEASENEFTFGASADEAKSAAASASDTVISEPYDEAEDAVGAVFVSEDEDEEETTVVTAPPEEEVDGGYAEIPPERQNSDVVAQRKMFSFLSDEEKDSESDEDEVEFPERPAPEARAEETAPEDEYSNEDAESDEESAPGESRDGEDEKEEEEAPPRRSAFAERMLAMERQKSAVVAEEEPEIEPEPEKPDYSDYVFPSIDLLVKGKFEEDINQEEEKNANAEKLVDALLQFNVRISIKAIDRGPRITRYEIVPARGVKVNAVTSLFYDIQLSLGVEGMRMEAPIPGKSAIGVEIPNKKSTNVLLRDLVESDEFTSAPSKTMSCLGKDVTGNPVFADIAKMPHILIAGATGMGKSVCINAVLLSILYKARPDEVKLIMIDPKKVEFARYNGIPHLLIPVVTDVKQAAGALMWAVEQMEKRYELLQKLEVSKIDNYNEKVRQNPSLGEPLPKIIIVIDELNDIMLQVRKPAEELIMSIAQKARAAGIHLIIGTQRPSVDVITGVIKANIPSRISCKVASYNDSKTILEQAGAEKLLNNGDMLYIPAGAPKALRVQGAFVTDEEVSAVAKHVKSQVKGPIYDERALDEINKAAQKCQKGKGNDEIDDDDCGAEDGVGILNDQQFLDAVDVALRSGKIATSLLQRKLRVGYAKAASFIDYMEDFGIVGPPSGSKPRDVLITRDEWREMLSRRSLD